MVERSLARLAGLVSRRRRAVFAMWVALLAAGGWFSLHQNDFLSGGGWEVPGSASVRVSDALTAGFPSITTPAFTVFVTNPHGARAALIRARRLVATDPHVRIGR